MKKTLKKIGKTVGIILASVIGFLALLCIITLLWGAAQRTRGSVTDSLPVTPEDFTPAVRIVVFTDTHNENENVADAIDTSYALFDNDETAYFRLGKDVLEQGKSYTAYITAESAYHKKSDTAELNFTAE